ncbi:MAG: ferritin-like domain-containing protein [Pseudomonadota bacterium]
MDLAHWIRPFEANKTNRPEPDWAAPVPLPPQVRCKLTRSLAQFQLGDGGGPASLIAWNAGRFRDQSAEMRRLVDAWFDEEKEHSRLLLAAIRRFGGRPITGHWRFSCFLFCRRWFGVRVELTVLLLTEIASTSTYRLLRRHCGDPAVAEMCGLTLRDEAGHIRFHGARLAAEGRRLGPLRRAVFRLLGHAAGTMLWINHGAALTVLGGSRAAFYAELRRELSGFLTRHETAIGIRHCGGLLPPPAPQARRVRVPRPQSAKRHVERA